MLPEVQAPPTESTIEAVSPRPSARRPLLAALVTTIIVTLLSYLGPAIHVGTSKLRAFLVGLWRPFGYLLPILDAGTLVGLAFLVATWWLVLRADEQTIRHHGLSLGGLLEPLAIDWRRILREAAISVAWVLLLVVLVFPPFWLGFKLFWHVRMPFVWTLPKSLLEDIAGQLLVVALPEEAFFRGYLQTQLDDVWGRKIRFLGADVGFGWFISAIIFAVGHFLTTPSPARLAVFFPALLFGFLRARTGGIGAGVLFHALCNLFSAFLMRGYGFT